MLAAKDLVRPVAIARQIVTDAGMQYVRQDMKRRVRVLRIALLAVMAHVQLPQKRRGVVLKTARLVAMVSVHLAKL